ncbi:uncharacterized [Tachysurus ichikawai]
MTADLEVAAAHKRVLVNLLTVPSPLRGSHDDPSGWLGYSLWNLVKRTWPFILYTAGYVLTAGYESVILQRWMMYTCGTACQPHAASSQLKPSEEPQLLLQ